MSTNTKLAAFDAAIAAELPLPRLQLRWERNPDYRTGKPGSDYGWRCHYELILPLDKYDVRREVYKNGRELKRKLPHLIVPIKEPSLRGSSREPCTAPDGTRYCDAPFRDGAHALWDAKVLGSPPIYVIAPDGMAFLHGDQAATTGKESGRA